MEPLEQEQTTTTRFSVRTLRPHLVVAVVGFVLLVLGGWYLFVYKAAQTREVRVYQEVTTVGDATKLGLHDEALKQYETLVASGSLSPDQKALALRNVFDSLIKTQGGVNNLIKGIADVKRLTEDPTVSPEQKANLIRLLAKAYDESGRNGQVYKEIFSGDAYSKFLVAKNPSRSIRNVLQWSYDTYPTSRAGISIAAAYAGEALSVHSQYASAADLKDADAASQKALTTTAAQMLAESEGLFEKETEERKMSPKRSAYWGYKYWHAFTTAALAVVVGNPYTEEYDREYADIEAALKNDAYPQVQQFLPSAYWMHAYFLVVINKDEKKARAVLAQLMDLVESDPNYEANDFVRVISDLNSRDKQQKDLSSVAISRLSAISPELKAFVAGIE